MMHFKPWDYHQQLLMDQNPCYQYMVNDLQAYYAASEHQEEDYNHLIDEMPSDTSSDLNLHLDIFRLAFEASQWSKLVLNAEGLFNQLIKTDAPHEQSFLKNQIEQWLCLKQEYDECIAGDDSISLQGFKEHTKKSLERIEEVTETDDKSSESRNWIHLQSTRRKSFCSESEAFEEEDQSSDNENLDFLDKLDEKKKKLELETDIIVDSRKNDLSKLKDVLSEFQPISSNILAPSTESKHAVQKLFRRKSTLSRSDVINETMECQKKFSTIYSPKTIDTEVSYSNKKYFYNKLHVNFDRDSKKTVLGAQGLPVHQEQDAALETLINENEDKQSQLKKIQHFLYYACRQLDEMQKLAKVKEDFCKYMVRNFNVRSIAQQYLYKKYLELKENQKQLRTNQKKLEENLRVLDEKYNVCRKALRQKGVLKNMKDAKSAYLKELDKCQSSLLYYEKKLENNEIIRKFVGDPEELNTNLKNLLSLSKKKVDDLKKLIKSKEEQKMLLENELSSIHKNFIKLKEKYNLDVINLATNTVNNNNNNVSNSKYKIKFDTKPEGLCEENQKFYSNTVHTNKSSMENKCSVDDKEPCRQEIYVLRQLKDQLIDLRYKLRKENNLLHKKVKNYQTTADKELRQLIIINENIETIDEVIEQKNVIICEDNYLNENKLKLFDDQMPILNCIKKLTHYELVILFQKYFYKVIDLKESIENLETQNERLETNQDLDNDLKFVQMAYFFGKQINHLLDYCNEEWYANDEKEILIKENHHLKRRLAQLETFCKANDSNPRSVESLKPNHEVNQLVPINYKDQKVIREGNKIIIYPSR